MSDSKTPVLDELRERIDSIRALIYRPEPGLWSWRVMLANQMRDLIDWWNEEHSEPQECTREPHHDGPCNGLRREDCFKADT